MYRYTEYKEDSMFHNTEQDYYRVHLYDKRFCYDGARTISLREFEGFQGKFLNKGKKLRDEFFSTLYKISELSYEMGLIEDKLNWIQKHFFALYEDKINQSLEEFKQSFYHNLTNLYLKDNLDVYDINVVLVIRHDFFLSKNQVDAELSMNVKSHGYSKNREYRDIYKEEISISGKEFDEYCIPDTQIKRLLNPSICKVNKYIYEMILLIIDLVGEDGLDSYISSYISYDFVNKHISYTSY